MPAVTQQTGRDFFARRKLYREGLAYGRKTALRMSPARRADNARMVRESDYFQPSSPTRAYWLAFVRAMREN